MRASWAPGDLQVEDCIGEKVNLGSQSPFDNVFVKIGWSGRILMVRHAPELFAGG